MSPLGKLLLGTLLTTGLFIVVGLGAGEARGGYGRPTSARRARATHVPVRRR